jgi:hypothetical protein
MPQMLTRRTAVDGTETWMELIHRETLKALMDASRHRTDGGPDCSSIPKLAQAAGVSPAAIGFLVSAGKSHRKTCSVAMATSIANALGRNVEALFIERRSSRVA